MNATPVLKGTLDLIVLKALSCGPSHGYGIATWIERGSAGALQIEDSALYQALHRLERRKLVEGEWALTEKKRQARYYTLTEAGRQHLRSEADSWLQYSRSVTALLSLASAEV